MLGIIITELFSLAVIWLVFIVMYSFRREEGKTRLVKWWKTPMGRQLMGVSLLGFTEAVALILAGMGHRPPYIVYVVVFGAINILAARWLWLAYKARTDANHTE